MGIGLVRGLLIALNLFITMDLFKGTIVRNQEYECSLMAINICSVRNGLIIVLSLEIIPK